MKKLFFLFISFIYLNVNAQFEIKLTESYSSDIDVRFTESYNADIDIRFVDSEHQADFTVGFTNNKSDATVSLSKDGYSADLNAKISESYNADIDIRITDSYNADVDIMIKKSGIVDYLIFSDEWPDRKEVIVACLPIINANSNKISKVEKIPFFFKNCGKIILPSHETQISDSFDGFDWDEKVYELNNGLYISSNQSSYEYCYAPNVKLFYCEKWYASIECYNDGELVEVNVYR